MPKALHILLFVSILAIVADVFLFAGTLTFGTSLMSAVLSGAITLWVAQHTIVTDVPQASSATPERDSTHSLGLWILFTLSTASFFSVLLSHQITESVRTPWAMLPLHLLIYFGISFACAVAIRHWMMNIVVAFMYVGVAALAYPLGFGFDGFLHRTAELAIVQTGDIQPLPFLYGGQYALIVAFHHLTSIPIDFLERFLVPGLFALVFPALFSILYQTERKPSASSLGVLCLLPLSAFTVTTPFAFSVLLFVTVVFLCAFANKQERLLIALPLAVAACTIHVIAGVPALIMIGLSFLRGNGGLVTGSLVSSLAVPSLLATRLWLSGHTIALNLDASRLRALLGFVTPTTTFRVGEDTLYLASALAVLFFVICVVVGLFRRASDARLNHLLAGSLGFMLSGIILTAFQFPDVIHYEQTDYAQRLLLLACFGLAPFAFLGFHSIVERLRRQELTLQFLSVLALALLTVGHLYVLYPRADRHVTSKGFNVSANDFLAARVIRTDAGNSQYIVLSPQTTSAAFLREFGFPPTIPTPAGDILPYAVPTGGVLYQYFLRITEQIDLRAIPEAAALTDARLVYVTLPTWWWRFDEIEEPLTASASGSFTIGDIRVWKFVKR